MPSPSDDLLIIGGGIMGLFTAYHASQRFERVTVLERGRIGDPMTASYGRTRSFRNDYLDAEYTRLAHEAFRLWGEFEARTETQVLVRCGCMNIAKRAVTPDLASTYAQLSHDVLAALGLRTESLDRDALGARFRYLDADMGRLDVDAGVVDLAAVTAALTRALEERGVRVVEDAEITAIARDGDALRVTTGARWVLLEVPFAGVDDAYLAACAHVRERGFGLLIGHPERAEGFLRGGHRMLRHELAAGALLQVNVCSLLGRQGPTAHAGAVKLVRDGHAYVLASDGHGGNRAHTLAAGRPAAREAGVSALRARQLTEANPRFLLESGIPADYGSASSVSRTFSHSAT